MLQKFEFDEYSAILSHSFYHRTCPWLPEQHSGFTCSHGLKDLGSAIWYKFERIFTRIIFVLTICYVARACLGKAVESLAWLRLHPIHKSCHCHPEPNSIYFIQEKNNIMYLVQHGSGLVTAQCINWVLNHFFWQRFFNLQDGRVMIMPLPSANYVFLGSNVASNTYFCKKPFINYLLQTDMIYFTNQCLNLIWIIFKKGSQLYPKEIVDLILPDSK